MTLSRRAFGLSAGSLLTLSACGQRAAPSDILRIGLGGAADSLDPLKAETAVAAVIFRQIWEPLTRYAPNDGVAPGLIARWESFDNATRWVGTLAPGRVWSDGAPITVSDVVESWRFAADPKTAYPDVAEFFAIAGLAQAAAGKAPPDSIAVRAVGDAGIEFRLVAPDAQFDHLMREFYPTPMAMRAKYGDAWVRPENIVVSGPYKPTAQTQLRIELERNERYPGAKGPARLSVEAIDDAATRVRMFRSGDLDLMADPPLSQLDSLRDRFGDQLKRWQAPKFIYLSFNTKKAPFDQPAVRKALGATVDRAAIAKAVFRDAVQPAFNFDREPARYPPQGPAAMESAAAALKAAGFGPENPLRFELAVVKDERERVALQIQDMWKPLGVACEIFGSEGTGIITKLNEGDFDVGLTRIDKGLKDNILDLLASYSAQGTARSHGWTDPAFDAAIAAARAEADPAVRREKDLAVERIAMDAGAVSPLYFAPALWLASDRVTLPDSTLQPVFWNEVALKT